MAHDLRIGRFQQLHVWDAQWSGVCGGIKLVNYNILSFLGSWSILACLCRLGPVFNQLQGFPIGTHRTLRLVTSTMLLPGCEWTSELLERRRRTRGEHPIAYNNLQLLTCVNMIQKFWSLSGSTWDRRVLWQLPGENTWKKCAKVEMSWCTEKGTDKTASLLLKVHDLKKTIGCPRNICISRLNRQDITRMARGENDQEEI